MTGNIILFIIVYLILCLVSSLLSQEKNYTTLWIIVFMSIFYWGAIFIIPTLDINIDNVIESVDKSLNYNEGETNG
jgi:hypothetical protein